MLTVNHERKSKNENKNAHRARAVAKLVYNILLLTLLITPKIHNSSVNIFSHNIHNVGIIKHLLQKH